MPATPEQALDRLLLLTVLLHDDMTTSLAALGLTEARTRVVWELHRRGPSTQRELAEALHVSARTMTGLVDGLAETGFVTREPHPHDRRATHVTFTAHGAKVAAGLAGSQAEFARQLFGERPDRRTVEVLDELLGRLSALGVKNAA